MLKLRKVAITGGISSGKTTVCRILEKHGACTLNSDQIIHHLLNYDSSCINKTRALLGPTILVEGKIDREKVAEIVFNDKEKLTALEKILHPKLFVEIDQEYSRAQKSGAHRLFAVEMPLVQEIGKEGAFDGIVSVVCAEDQACERYIKKGHSKKMYDKRMKRQWSVKKKEAHADYIIRNDGTIKDLEDNTLKTMKEICSK